MLWSYGFWKRRLFLPESSTKRWESRLFSTVSEFHKLVMQVKPSFTSPFTTCSWLYLTNCSYFFTWRRFLSGSHIFSCFTSLLKLSVFSRGVNANANELWTLDFICYDFTLFAVASYKYLVSSRRSIWARESWIQASQITEVILSLPCGLFLRNSILNLNSHGSLLFFGSVRVLRCIDGCLLENVRFQTVCRSSNRQVLCNNVRSGP